MKRKIGHAKRQRHIDSLLEMSGLDWGGFLDTYGFQVRVPGICTACSTYTETCGATAENDPCGNCNEDAVVSGLVLLGVV